MAAEVRERVRAFVRSHVLGRERELDRIGPLPLAFYEAFQRAGLANWWLPRSLGGQGIGLTESVGIVEELAYGDAGLAFAFFLPILGSTVVELFASDGDRERCLRRMAASGSTCATLASEQDAGSELFRLASTATRVDGGFRLDGAKYFSTNAELADFFVVYARLSEDSFGAFLVPRGAHGLEIRRRWPKLGLRASGTYEVSLGGCRAGEPFPGNGLRILEVGLNTSRTLIAASAIGIGRRVRDLCLDYARAKPIKGATLDENPVFVAKLGQIEAELEAMRSVCRTAAAEFDGLAAGPGRGEDLYRAGSLKSVLVAKLVCGQLGWKIASVGSEALGGFGYTEESLMGKLVRDMRHVSIVEAGDDVLRELLYARYVVPEDLVRQGCGQERAAWAASVSRANVSRTASRESL